MTDTKIKDQISRLFAGADDRDWPTVRSVMNERILLDYSSMNGRPATYLSPQQITDAWSAVLPGFDKTKHKLSCFIITAHANVAMVRFNGHASHWIADKCWTVDGTYEVWLNCTDNEWLVTEMAFHLDKQSP